MFPRLPFVSSVLLFLFCLSGISASPKANPQDASRVARGISTNAKRLAAGLPPLPPVRRWQATKVQLAKKQVTSALPPSPITGRIMVTGSTGYIGYLFVDSTAYNNGNLAFGITTNAGLANTFQSTPVAPVGTTTHVKFQNLNAGAPYLETSSAATFVPGDGASVTLGGPYGLHPATDIWNYDALTGAITAQYVNPDGSLPPTSIVYYAPLSRLYLTATPSGDRPAVSFTFVPI